MIERYSGLELSLNHALRIIPAAYRTEYEQAYRWLIADANTRGPRPYGEHAPSGMKLKLTAQRGIHKPGGRPYALTISSSGNEVYAADRVHGLDDGTWMFQYCAHRRNSGEKEGSAEFNASLRKCLRDGIPVGVFIKSKGTWEHKGLAFVEQYDSALDMFWLHGPVTDFDSKAFSPIIDEEAKGLALEFDSSKEEEELTAEDLRDERERIVAEVIRRKQQGLFRARLLEAYDCRCAISLYDAEPALQAAHISSYLGKKSQLVTNGILLRADLHTLYDRSWLSIDPSNMTVRLAPQLLETRYGDYEGKQVLVPRDRALRPSESRLEMKYSDFLLANQMNR